MPTQQSFLDLVLRRRSARKYLSTPVERERLERCLEAARLAPSSCNGQPWKFIVVDDPAKKAVVAQETYGPLSVNHFTLQVPVLVLVVAETTLGPSMAGSIVRGVPLHYIDIGIAVEHFCLQAAEEGLGTCILGWLKSRRIHRLLNIPRHKKIALAIAVAIATMQLLICRRRIQETKSECTKMLKNISGSTIFLL